MSRGRNGTLATRTRRSNEGGNGSGEGFMNRLKIIKTINVQKNKPRSVTLMFASPPLSPYIKIAREPLGGVMFLFAIPPIPVFIAYGLIVHPLVAPNNKKISVSVLTKCDFNLKL